MHQNGMRKLHQLACYRFVIQKISSIYLYICTISKTKNAITNTSFSIMTFHIGYYLVFIIITTKCILKFETQTTSKWQETIRTRKRDRLANYYLLWYAAFCLQSLTLQTPKHPQPMSDCVLNKAWNFLFSFHF